MSSSRENQGENYLPPPKPTGRLYYHSGQNPLPALRGGEFIGDEAACYLLFTGSSKQRLDA